MDIDLANRRKIPFSLHSHKEIFEYLPSPDGTLLTCFSSLDFHFEGKENKVKKKIGGSPDIPEVDWLVKVWLKSPNSILLY
jgi:hypothetical protein